MVASNREQANVFLDARRFNNRTAALSVFQSVPRNPTRYIDAQSTTPGPTPWRASPSPIGWFID
jgi:hypothetical protein